ncbi:MAG TPA: DUF2510 domain-containing protein [Actinospica sp.]|jgi:hypothetical protein|nr:DUF2510 domain-containing protein [Actinospica sp.]
MSIPDHNPEPAAPAGWYSTGEAGPDGTPVERWWDGAQWSAMVRPLGSGTTGGPGRGNRTRALIAAAVVVVLVGGGLGTYFALHNSSSTTPTAQNTPTTGPTTGLGGGNGGSGQGNGGLGGGTGGLGGGQSASPEPTVTGGSGQTISDPIDGLTIPVPSGWTGNSGSTSGQGSWPALSTGPYTCPSALASSNGSTSGSAGAQCTRGGVSFTTVSGSAAQSVATSDIATLAKDNYGSLSSHTVSGQGAITVAGRSGYQVTWKVVPSYSGPGGTVEAIALPVPGQSGYFTLIDIGVDDSAQAPSLSSVNSSIINAITDSSAAGA